MFFPSGKGFFKNSKIHFAGGLLILTDAGGSKTGFPEGIYLSTNKRGGVPRTLPYHKDCTILL